MSLRRHGTVVSVPLMALALTLAACSGAADNDVLDPVATSASTTLPGKTATGTAGAATTSGAAASGTTAGGTATGTSSTPTNTASDPGTPTTIEPPIDTTDPTAECVTSDGADSPQAATEFTSCVTGELNARGDNQYVRITAPDDARTMQITHQESGKTLYRISSGGNDLPIQLDQAEFTDGDQSLHVIGGATYLFEVTAMGGGGQGNGDSRTFQLDVSFTTKH